MNKRKFLYIYVAAVLLASYSVCTVEAAEKTQEAIPQQLTPDEKKVMQDDILADPDTSSTELLRLARQASYEGKLDRAKLIVQRCEDLYGDRAVAQQESLTEFPERGSEDNYQELNDVATCIFTLGEAYMAAGKTPEAIETFQKAIDNYKWAQAWDPRGWFWSVAEKSQDSINALTGKEDSFDVRKTIKSRPKISNLGAKKFVDYSKYGNYHEVGTSNYHYEITNPKGLKKAVGDGVFPNARAVFKEPRYLELQAEGRLKGSHWDFVNTEDLEAAYYKWISAPEPWGVKLFYLGTIYERAGMITHAIKSYHALIVHFPKTVAFTYWQTPWYPAQAAIAKIKHLLRMNPNLNLESKWMKITVKNGFDNETDNDEIITYPGVIREKGIVDKARDTLLKYAPVNLGKVTRRLGKGKVHLAQYDNGHWQLIVNRKPYVLRGITYAPTKIGQSPDKGTLQSWMTEDHNENGKVDGPYDSWVDKNRNNKRDKNERIVGDFQLMKEMGVNTIREYHQPFELDKDVFRAMYKKYGFRVIVGDFLGKYTLGSGATWFEGTDYENEEHKKNMMESVRKMVMEHKDEDYLLFWLLGNENNYGVASNADKKPEAYFKFANEVAKMIKELDPDHPVALCNGDTLFLDKFAEFAPDIDIFSANVYRGDYGFGSFWDQVLDATDKPAFITEYGAPAFAQFLSLDEAEQAQAAYHKGNWLDIEANLAGTTDGVGNALGGVIFEWLDEWWKNYEPYKHDKKSDAVGPFPGGYYFEEWFGIVGQGEGTDSPYMRQLRQSYYTYKALWEKFK